MQQHAEKAMKHVIAHLQKKGAKSTFLYTHTLFVCKILPIHVYILCFLRLTQKGHYGPGLYFKSFLKLYFLCVSRQNIRDAVKGTKIQVCIPDNLRNYSPSCPALYRWIFGFSHWPNIPNAWRCFWVSFISDCYSQAKMNSTLFLRPAYFIKTDGPQSLERLSWVHIVKLAPHVMGRW